MLLIDRAVENFGHVQLMEYVLAFVITVFVIELKDNAWQNIEMADLNKDKKRTHD